MSALHADQSKTYMLLAFMNSYFRFAVEGHAIMHKNERDLPYKGSLTHGWCTTELSNTDKCLWKKCVLRYLLMVVVDPPSNADVGWRGIYAQRKFGLMWQRLYCFIRRCPLRKLMFHDFMSSYEAWHIYEAYAMHKTFLQTITKVIWAEMTVQVLRLGSVFRYEVWRILVACNLMNRFCFTIIIIALHCPGILVIYPVCWYLLHIPWVTEQFTSGQPTYRNSNLFSLQP